MDHAKRQEEWSRIGDLAYVIAASAGNKSVNQHTFNRYRQMMKASQPTRTVKPSELTEIG